MNDEMKSQLEQRLHEALLMNSMDRILDFIIEDSFESTAILVTWKGLSFEVENENMFIGPTEYWERKIAELKEEQ